MIQCRIVPVGDSTLVIEIEAQSDVDTGANARAVAIATAVEAAGVAGVLDVVPTFRTVAVYFDPLTADAQALAARLEQEARATSARTSAEGSRIRIPVCYGGAFGPDLPDVASTSGLTEDAVVALHARPGYRVFMFGFMPGFAYLGPVDPHIAMPRRETPRSRVAAGSVGIAGHHTGIYPSDSPGGWQLIGRTPVKPFDPERAEPFLLRPGDRVEFYPIDHADYLEGCAWQSST